MEIVTKINKIEVIILIFAVVIGALVFNGDSETVARCEFAKSIDNCNTSCNTDVDCKYSLGFCVNVNEDVYLPEMTSPVYIESTCKCENTKCVFNSTTGNIVL